MYVSVVNMSKSCWFAFVLAVICLSLEADAQPTVDETMTCGSSTLEEVVNKITSNQQQNAKKMRDEIRDVKKTIESGCQETNETKIEDVVKEIKEIESKIDLLRDEVKEVKRLLSSNTTDCESVTANPLESVTSQPSTRSPVSTPVSNCSVPLLIQQNDGTDFFNRSWAEFKVGFGNTSGNYWLGNELLSQLTVNHRYKLKFDLQSLSNTSNWYWAEYSTFRVLTEADNYRLQVSGYSGNAGYDALTHDHNGAMFTTYDRDNDQWSANCAVSWGGGFWYKSCAWCSVNVARSTGFFYWWGLPGGHALQSTRMWLQCK